MGARRRLTPPPAAPRAQDWTKLENDDAQGLVEINYRTAADPGRPPDVQVIQKQMAIVAWQPGPNRVLQVPSEVRGRGFEGGDRPRVGGRGATCCKATGEWPACSCSCHAPPDRCSSGLRCGMPRRPLLPCAAARPQSELQQLKPGDVLERIPAAPSQRLPYETTGKLPPPLRPDPFEGTWEVLTQDAEGRPFLDRHDVWGWVPNSSSKTSSFRGLNFNS